MADPGDPRPAVEAVTAAVTHPRLAELVARARVHAGAEAPAVGIVYPCDGLALKAAQGMAAACIARPVLIGPADRIHQAADAAGVPMHDFELIATADDPVAAAHHAVMLARADALAALMKGSLHTDELMSAVVRKENRLRGAARISHAFVFDQPRYHKLIALADCVVNITPDLKTKHDILGNAVGMLQRLGVAAPKVGVVAAVETVNPAIAATLDAQALVRSAREGAWPGAIVEGPFGFDNAISAEAARIKGMDSQVAGDPDLLIVPDLNAGNLLYKSFVYMGGGDCAGLVLGARVPVVLTSRADSAQARLASVALAVLTGGVAY